MRKSTILGTLLAFLPLARGALYPTRPIAKTTLRVGKEETIKWTDDGKAPHLRQMGPMKLDLFAANNVRTSTVLVNPDDAYPAPRPSPFPPLHPDLPLHAQR